MILASLALLVLPAPEARQGVAVDRDSIYAIDNSTIARYDRRSGQLRQRWRGDPRRFPHINSCGVVGRELVCAASNYPAIPMQSRVEFFDKRSLRHLRSRALPAGYGSVTVFDRHAGSWWGVFANYDGRGGEPGRDHRATVLVRFDDGLRAKRRWRFPAAVLERFAPRSCSGGAFGRDGRFYASGHDLPEVYVLALPSKGDTLRLERTVAVTTPGQAIDLDPLDRALLWGIDRRRGEIRASRIAPPPHR